MCVREDKSKEKGGCVDKQWKHIKKGRKRGKGLQQVAWHRRQGDNKMTFTSEVVWSSYDAHLSIALVSVGNFFFFIVTNKLQHYLSQSVSYLTCLLRKDRYPILNSVPYLTWAAKSVCVH